MVYRVKTRKGYWEERESYRDPVTGKPRSRFLRYLGKLGVPNIDWGAAFASEPGIAAADRAMEQAEKERGPMVEEVSRLPDGLHVGPTDPVAAVDKSAPEAPEPSAASEPDAEPSA